MLVIKLSATEDSEATEVHLEHSLVSLSKWESIHEKAFFGSEAKTELETLSYVNQMVLGENSPAELVSRFTIDDFTRVNEYINSRQTATWFQDDPNTRKSTEVITSELVYYWLISFQVPFECETWHFNRLMTLIRICGVKQSKPKKMSRQAQAEQYRSLNAQRKAQMGTSG